MKRVIDRIQMEDFKRVLNQEIEVHTDIEQLLAHKKETIVQGDLDTLAKLDTTLEKLTQRIRELEQERLALMVRMGNEGETLREFIDSLATGEDARLLAQAREKLVQATTEIKHLSQTNRDLLTQSIRFIEQSVDFIASILAPEGASYSNAPAGRRAVLDSHREYGTGGVPSTISHNA